jgi:hypothetical protein
MRRIILRILFGFMALILLAALGVQIVLFTNVPRNMVLRSLEKQLHLRAETRSFSTGWLGHTTLQGVSLSLPLGNHPILAVETLNVRHTALLPLLFGRDLTITRLEFDHPTVRIVHGEDGRWNVQHLASLFGSGSGSGPSGASSSPPVLPAIDFVDGTVEIVDGTRHATLDQFNFKGEPEGILSWKIELSLADRVKLDGRLAPGSSWEHDATVSVHDVADWARPWFVLPADFAAQVRWHGRASDGGIRGRLDAADIKAAGCDVVGGIDVSQSEQGIDLHPDNLRVTTRLGAIPQFTATSGSVRWQNSIARAQSLQLAAYGGPANVTGYYDFANQVGELAADWDQLLLPGKIVHSGTLTFNIHRPLPRHLIIDGTLFSSANTPQGPWRATLNFGGQGETNSDFSWHAIATELVWNRRTPIHLDGLEALGSIQRPGGRAASVSLTSLHLPQRQWLNGNGFYRLADRSWDFKLAGDRLPVQLIQNALMGFDLDAAGNSSVVTLNHFTLTQAQTTIAVNGSYRFGIPKPVLVTVALASRPAAEAVAGQRRIIEGAMRGDAQMDGTLVPLGLNLQGHLYGRAMRVASRDIGDIALRVTGVVNGEHARLETERLRALGGDWAFQTTYAFADDLVDADLRVGGLPLQNIAIATDTTPMGGTLAGEWDAYFLHFPLDLRNIRLRGEGSIRNLDYKGISADEVHFTTTMEGGGLALDPITMKLGSAGHGTGSLKWNLDQPHHVNGALSLSDWPMQSGDAAAVVKLDVPAIAIDLPAGASGATAPQPLGIYADTVNATAAFQYGKKPLGNAALTGTVEGQIASITDLHGSFLDAPANGTAQIDIVNPLNSRGSASFEKLDTARLAALFPQLTGLSGTLRGAASVDPAAARHPLEPLAFHLQTTFDQGHYRALSVGVFNLNGFMNTRRVVLDDRPGHESTLDIADGNVRLWGRFAHPEPKVFSSQAELRLSNLDLNEIANAIHPQTKPTPGKLGGDIMLLYNTRAAPPPPPSGAPATGHVASPAMREFMRTVYGETRLDLTESNMVTLPILSDLYTIFSLGRVSAGHHGHGSAEARLEDGTLFVSNIHYFNSGFDSLMQVKSPDMWDFPYNNVEGAAVGSVRPFRALKLPVISDLESALGALQGSLYSARLGGTWHDIQRTPITLSNLGREMQDLLFGNISNNSEQPQDQSPQP